MKNLFKNNEMKDLASITLEALTAEELSCVKGGHQSEDCYIDTDEIPERLRDTRP